MLILEQEKNIKRLFTKIEKCGQKILKMRTKDTKNEDKKILKMRTKI